MRYFKLLILMLFILTLSPGAFAQMPVDAAIVQVNPPFEGVELIYSSATIFAYNEYGDYRLDVRPGTVVGAPNPLLDGLVHNDTVAQAPTRGSIIYSDATPEWNELVIGAINTLLTSDGVDVAYALPVVQTSTLLDNAVHTDTVTSAEAAGALIYGTGAGWDDLAVGAVGDVLTQIGGFPAWVAPGALAGAWGQLAETTEIVAGAGYTRRVGPAYATLIQDVVVVVTCRSLNGGVVWHALSHPTPVADFVTYCWVDDGAGNMEFHISNDSQMNIECTISYADL